MHSKHLLILALCSLLPAFGMAQTEQELEAKKKGLSKLDRSATEFFLQRPRVTKRFDHKIFGDHLFLEGAAGLTYVPLRSSSGDFKKVSAIGGIAFGDWVSPEHGWRISMNPAFYKHGADKFKTFSMSVDYIMNMTAVANYRYKKRKSFEVIGAAGGSYIMSYFNGKRTNGFGVHLGLRGQYNFSNLTYIYLEPQVGLAFDEIFQKKNTLHFRPLGHLLAGLGYNLQTNPERFHDKASYKDFFRDGTFFSIGVGPSFIVTPYLVSFQRNRGMLAQLSIGKWFDPFSAVRLSGHASLYRNFSVEFNDNIPDEEKEKLRGGGARLDYMLNLHNLFGGPHKNRPFWVNAIVGVNYSYMKDFNRRKSHWGFGGALQGNLSVWKNTDIFLEPRIDIYNGDYVRDITSLRKYNWDVVPSLVAGMSFHGSAEGSELRAKNKEFKSDNFLHHTFAEVAAGVTMAPKPFSVKHPKTFSSPQSHLGFGKWFKAGLGARVWTESGKIVQTVKYKSDFVTLGADLLWNITNSLNGYEPKRPCELILGVGANMAVSSKSLVDKDRKTSVGGNFGLKGVWHLSPLFGLYIEPQLRIYNGDYLAKSGASNKVDYVAALMLGTQVDLVGQYDRPAARAAFEEDGKCTFVSLSGGATVQANYSSHKGYYGPRVQFAFGRWFAPGYAWRITASGTAKRIRGVHFSEAMLGADYMIDCSALAFGYRKDRPVTLRTYLGGAVGVDYMRHIKSSIPQTFVPEVHFGGQVAARMGSNAELFLEPQMAYKFGKRYVDKVDHLHPSLMLGLAYNMRNNDGSLTRKEQPKYRQFVNVGIGAGCHTMTATQISPGNRKITLETGLGYGRWWNAYNGFNLAYHHSVLQARGKGNRNVMSVQVNYMLDLASTFSHMPADERIFQLTGSLGAGLYMGKRKDESTRFAPGVQAALQIGARVASNIDIYLEPAAEVYPKSLFNGGSSHPADGGVRVQLGARYNF